jgi:5-methylcytosine-specific restriction endonuclease McrA
VEALVAYSPDEIQLIYDRTAGACFYCGNALALGNQGRPSATGAWEVDHFIPLEAHGAHLAQNWVAACVDCRTRKSDQMPWEHDPFRFKRGARHPDDYL